MKHPLRWRRGLLVVAVVVITVFAVRAVAKQLHTIKLHDLELAVAALPAWRFVAAATLTALSYLVLTGYDALGVRYVKHPLPYRKTAFASFLGYVFSYNVGLSVLGGTAVRLRLYSAWGLSTIEIARIVAFAAMTFWLGLMLIAGSMFVIVPQSIPPLLGATMTTTRPIGLAMLGGVLAYFTVVLIRRTPVRLGAWSFELPTPKMTVAQAALASVDLMVAALVCYVLLPGERPFGPFVGAYGLAVFAAMVSHVPGGVGVFEGVILALVPGDKVTLLAGLVCYRVVYYLAPLSVAAVLLAIYELRTRRVPVVETARKTARAIRSVAPTMIAASVAMAGLILLLSGATPLHVQRLRRLGDIVPLGVIETSQLLASVLGVCLLVLAWALARRMDGAWWASIALLALGVVSAALSGHRYEESLLLGLALLALVGTRRHFHRRSGLLAWRPDVAGLWTAAFAVAGGIGLVFVTHHVNLDDTLWRFGVDASAPRALRSLGGASIIIVVLSVWRLLGPAPPTITRPTAELIERARPIVAVCPRSMAHLALLGDKALLFGTDSAFIMYGCSGRTAVALGDPIGSLTTWRDLIWSFRDLARAQGLVPAFYQAGPEHLNEYIEQGFTALKLGEEARVPIHDYNLEGSHRKSERHSMNRMKKEGVTFDVIPADGVVAILPELRRVSDDWLSTKNAAEKGFSLGFFDDAYLCRTAVAVARSGSSIVAFANVWLSGENDELAPDLMRYAQDAPRGVMDYLFTQMMIYGHDHGYRWFNLGMAPLSGLDSRPLAPMWNKAGGLLYRHGEHFYNYQGLRSFKEKYEPQWEPRYLVTRGGFGLPRTLIDVATLISGGLPGLIGK